MIASSTESLAMILTARLCSVTVQVRFAVSMHARSESKKLAKAARREAVQGEAGITWSNNIR